MSTIRRSLQVVAGHWFTVVEGPAVTHANLHAGMGEVLQPEPALVRAFLLAVDAAGFKVLPRTGLKPPYIAFGLFCWKSVVAAKVTKRWPEHK